MLSWRFADRPILRGLFRCSDTAVPTTFLRVLTPTQFQPAPMDSADSSKSTPGSSSSASNSSLAAGAPLERSSSQSSSHKPSHIATHRQSFVENQRYPPSPRAHRHPSFTQQAIQELLITPPANRHANPRFAGRDWRDISLGELSPDEARWADWETSVEDATRVRLPVPRPWS